MVRSHWKGILILALAWAGVAQAQFAAPSAAPAGKPGERILTIREPGKPAEACRVVSTTQMPDGSTKLQVQSLATGEESTVFEAPKGGSIVSGPITTSVQVTHTPGTPVVVPVSGPQRGAPAPTGTGSAASDGECRTVMESGRPPLLCRVLRRWHTSQGSTSREACELVCTQTGEMLTVVETAPAEVPGAAPGTRVKAMAARIFHWGRYKTRPAGVPVPPDAAPVTVVTGPRTGAPVVVAKPAVIKPGPVEREPGVGDRVAARLHGIFHRPSASELAAPSAAVAHAPMHKDWRRGWGGDNVNMTSAQPAPPKPPAVVQVATKKPATEAPKAVVAANKPTVEPAKPTDWRQSWGDKDGKSADKTRGAKGSASAVAQVSTKPDTPSSPSRPPASATETAKRPDPLADPGSYAGRKVEEKVGSLKGKQDEKPLPLPPTTVQVSTNPPQPTPPASSSPAPKAPAAPRLPAPTTTATPSQPVQAKPVAQAITQQGALPLGAQSVLAASNGLERPVHYVPVPIVTMPERTRPPLPPVPEIPQAPQPNEKFVNAFTPPAPPGGQQGMPPQGYPPPVGPMAMAPGYPMMPSYPMMPGYPMMAQGGYPAGYGYYPMAAQSGHPGYAMQQTMYRPYPYGPMGAPNQAPGRGMVPYSYQGPMPPNPYARPPMVPAGYAPGYQGMVQAPNPAMDRPGYTAPMTAAQAAANTQVQQMINVLKTSAYPSQREWAAHNLGMCDDHTRPEVIQVLAVAAKDDPAPTVRAGCAYTLGRMRASGTRVMAVLQQLKSDTDPRVRAEADQALARLAPATDSNAVQPVRATNP